MNVTPPATFARTQDAPTQTSIVCVVRAGHATRPAACPCIPSRRSSGIRPHHRARGRATARPPPHGLAYGKAVRVGGETRLGFPKASVQCEVVTRHRRGRSRGRLHPRHHRRRPAHREARRPGADPLPARAQRLPAHRPRQVDLPQLRRSPSSTATRCNLRFDDTNPDKEDVEYVESHPARRRGGSASPSASRRCTPRTTSRRCTSWPRTWSGRARPTSTTSATRRSRSTGAACGSRAGRRPTGTGPWRRTWPCFRQMRAGDLPDGTCVLRARIDLAASNMKMRDPLLYRIRHAHHDRTGDAWCIYPMYDCAHPLSDAIEGITHSLCTLEFENNRELYDWVIAETGVSERHGFSPPQQIEFARLKLDYTVMSKRKLLTPGRGRPRLGLGRPPHAHHRRHAPARLPARGHPGLRRPDRRGQGQLGGRPRQARVLRARRPQLGGAPGARRAAAPAGDDHLVAGRRGREADGPLLPARRGQAGRADRALRAGDPHRPRRLLRRPAAGLPAAGAGPDGPAAPRLLHHLRRGRHGGRGGRRPAGQPRARLGGQEARRREGVGRHPLGVGRPCGAGRGAPVRPAVHGAPARRGRRRPRRPTLNPDSLRSSPAPWWSRAWPGPSPGATGSWSGSGTSSSTRGLAARGAGAQPHRDPAGLLGRPRPRAGAGGRRREAQSAKAKTRPAQEEPHRVPGRGPAARSRCWPSGSRRGRPTHGIWRGRRRPAHRRPGHRRPVPRRPSRPAAPAPAVARWIVNELPPALGDRDAGRHRR